MSLRQLFSPLQTAWAGGLPRPRPPEAAPSKKSAGLVGESTSQRAAVTARIGVCGRNAELLAASQPAGPDCWLGCEGHSGVECGPGLALAHTCGLCASEEARAPGWSGSPRSTPPRALPREVLTSRTVLVRTEHPVNSGY